MPEIKTAAPQFLVDDLAKSLAFYAERLGFTTDFVYEDFYAGISRGGATIHLKCAPKLEAERALRRENTHLDAYLPVDGAQELYEELRQRRAPIDSPPERRPWATLEFTVVDPDGYILCFSQTA